MQQREHEKDEGMWKKTGGLERLPMTSGAYRPPARPDFGVKLMSVTLVCICFLAVLPARAIEPCKENVTARIKVDPGHPWRPPFGLDRIGKPTTAVVEISFEPNLQAPYGPVREYSLVGYRDGKEVGRRLLQLRREGAVYTDTATFDAHPSELVLFAKCRFEGNPEEVARVAVAEPPFEADAVARPDEWVNPVDLGAIFVPEDWLILRSGQKASVEAAAFSSTQDLPGAQLSAWFESLPQSKAAVNFPLTKERRAETSLPLPVVTPSVDHDVLHVVISDAGGKELWQKKIQSMFIRKSAPLPAFGAIKTKLRYDLPISVRDFKTGEPSTINYADGWPASLYDVVVSFPTGARFVFWRGSSYVPFWAGRYNTGMTYEWAETSPPPGGFVDSVEPLMDKELRYGRVEIVESTPARVHVRWTYQSCDFTYRVWGDSAAEDFYFYPDGFGTRALTLQSNPGAEYELSEFIILTPPQAYPFAVLPRNLVDVIFLDGEKHEVLFPYIEGPKGKNYTWPEAMKEKARGTPVMYRVRLNKQESSTAIYFNPLDPHLAPIIYSPFFDRGYMVTPAYWGSHWPLARGKTTGWTIDDRIHISPAHNSLMTWGLQSRPTPLRTADIETIDTLGRSKAMTVRQWVWLIGMTDASDTRLLEWARSFSKPPSLEVKGARYDFDSYVPERRAFRLKVEEPTVAIMIKPEVKCLNPVFELLDAPKTLTSITLANQALGPRDYAWDGRTLW